MFHSHVLGGLIFEITDRYNQGLEGKTYASLTISLNVFEGVPATKPLYGLLAQVASVALSFT